MPSPQMMDLVKSSFLTEPFHAIVDSKNCTDRLIAAINAISADFACILTVTYMPYFRDAFQSRIEVTKTPQGSKISLWT